MSGRESQRLWPLLLLICSAILFGILAPFFAGMLLGAFSGKPRSKTVEIVRYVTVEGSASPQPAHSRF